ncbi:MAG TPA: hypothetical protein VGJ38_04505 [Jatrophihabitantaceae bacterium]|jgi:hypothetical protein
MSALEATPVAGARADDPRPTRLLRRAVIVAGAAGAAWFIGALLSATSADATPPTHPTPASASRPDAVTQLLGDTLRTVLGGKQPAAKGVAAQHVTHAVTHTASMATSSPPSTPATDLPVVVTGLLSQTTHTVQSVTDAVPVPALAEVVDPLVHTVDTVSDSVIAPTLTGLVTPLAPLLPQLQPATGESPAAVADLPAQPATPTAAARRSHAVTNVPRPPAIFAASRGAAAAAPRAGSTAQADLPASVPIPTAPPPGPDPGVPAAPDGTAAAAGSATGTNLMATPPAPGRSPRDLALVAVPLAARGIVRMLADDPGFSPD